MVYYWLLPIVGLKLAFHRDLVDFPSIIKVYANHVIGDVIGQREIKYLYAIVVVIRPVGTQDKDLKNLGWIWFFSP